MKKYKFSIIIPVYNVEKYLEDCLNSIYYQNYDNYEVIIINDGSTDNSLNVIEKYKNNKNTIIINQKNKGLSASRNAGLKHSTGDYLIFLDADDYLELDSLQILNKNIKNEDILRYQLIEVNDNKNIISEIKEIGFKNLTGIKAFNKIVKYKYIDNACIYCFRRNYFIDNKYNFKENYFHEDFGLIPIILYNATKVSSISNCLYNYRQRNDSIMHDKNINQTKKKCNDMFVLGLENIKKIEKNKNDDNNIFLSYIANCLIIKGRELPKKDIREYYKKLKDNKIFSYMLKNNYKRKIKYILAKNCYNIYLKVMK